MKIKHIFMVCACASCFTLSAQAHVNMLQAQLGTEATQSSSDEKAASTEVENRINEIKTTLKIHIGKVGYPTTASWTTFNEAVKTLTTVDAVNTELAKLFTQANLTMPEDGKAYYIRPVNKGKQVSERSANRLYYQNASSSLEIAVGGSDVDNAIFYAHQVGDKFVFTNNAGKYLTFRADGKKIDNNGTGFSDTYNELFLFKLFPMPSISSGDSQSFTSPTGTLELSGLVLLQSYMYEDSQNKGNELHYLMANTKDQKFHNGSGNDVYFTTDNNTCAFYLEEAPQQNSFTTKTLTVGNVNNANICTYSSPFPVVLPKSVDAYIATEQGDAIVLQKVTGAALPKNTGVILSTDEAKDYIPVARTTEEIATITEGTNKLVATTGKAIEGNVKAYVLAKDGSNNAVFKLLDANKRAVAQYKAYLNMTESSLSAIKLLFGNTTTAINSAKADVLNNKPATMYDLNGRKVGKLQQGIYIVNGKKIIVK